MPDNSNSMTRIFLYAALSLGIASLAAEWARAGYWAAGLVFLLLIPSSFFLINRKFAPATGLVLFLTVLFAGLGLLVGGGLSLALMAVLGTLAAWDLAGFSTRLAYAAPQDGPQALERQHLSRLNLVLFAGVALDLAAVSIRHAFGFEWTFLLAVLAFYGLAALFSGLKSQSG